MKCNRSLNSSPHYPIPFTHFTDCIVSSDLSYINNPLLNASMKAGIHTPQFMM
jgi:hypothetical protein